ncbi:hypothetical protein [Melittangium boletus]|uniref:hypothetical protein n=1 Tax=Melittangium boletus TaxID=83453 RepID=UPI001474C932|nr:hypothetical protein [Melittangium boletus]
MSRLLMEIRVASGAERQELTQRLNGHLEALGTGTGSREKADVLLRLLESGRLEGLGGPPGHTCRAVAVESLTRMGYPYALEVRPEDLAYLRDQTVSKRDGGSLARGGAAGVLVLGLVLQWSVVPRFVSHSFDAGIDSMLALAMGLTTLSLLAGLLAPQRSLTQRVGLGLLLALSLLQLWMGSRSGYHGQLSGAAGVLAWLLLMLPRR